MVLKPIDLGLRTKTMPPFLKVPGSTAQLFGATWSPQHQPRFGTHIKRLADVNYPLAPLEQERWDAKPKVGLWWSVLVDQLVGKKTTRSWSRRRFEHAMREVLQERGYGVDGIRKECGQARRNLTGRLDMTPFGSSIAAKFVDLKREINSILDVVDNLVEKSAKGGERLSRHRGSSRIVPIPASTRTNYNEKRDDNRGRIKILSKGYSSAAEARGFNMGSQMEIRAFR